MALLMKITIIVPVYNVEKYLRKCLDSIIAQTYRNFELLLINDGSKDSSGSICDEYAIIDKRIKVVHKSNSGVSVARNTGIKAATGELVRFIDSDDYVSPNYLECMVSAMEKNHSDICIQGLQHVRCDAANSTLQFKAQSVLFQELSSELFYKTILHRGPYCKLLRLSLLLKHNIFFPENISFGEDALFYYNYLLYCNQLSYVKECGYFYVQHEGETLSTKVHKPEQLAFHIKNRYSYTMQLTKKINSKIVFPEEFFQIKINELKILISSAFTHSYKLCVCKSIVYEIICDPNFNFSSLKPSSLSDKLFVAMIKTNMLPMYVLIKVLWVMRNFKI